eukprot:6213198-Pleurochrysis_carterae.AAC.4
MQIDVSKRTIEDPSENYFPTHGDECMHFWCSAPVLGRLQRQSAASVPPVHQAVRALAPAHRAALRCTVAVSASASQRLAQLPVGSLSLALATPLLLALP